MSLTTDAPTPTDREMVLAYQPSARTVTRPNQRRGGPEYRVIHTAPDGQRPELGPWCASVDRAWAATCLRLGLRLRRSVW